MVKTGDTASRNQRRENCCFPFFGETEINQVITISGKLFLLLQ